MDPQTKVNVEFKPAKRMKKRRELDALVNGKQGPSLATAAAFRSSGGGGGVGRGSLAPMRNGKHELLRNDSDSSEVEEFILPEKSLVRSRRGAPALCSVCVAVCWGVLLVVCLVGIGGLVWMCIQLKKDVDQLRIQLDKVGMVNANIPGQLRDVITEQERLSGRLSQLQSGDQGFEKLQKNISLLVRQVFDLEVVTKSLSQSVATAPQLVVIQSLPQQVKDLSKSVADLGSNLQTMEQSVGQLQEAKDQTEHQLSDIDARLKTLQLATTEQKTAEHKENGSNSRSSDDISKLDGLFADIKLMNLTFYSNLTDLSVKYSSQQTLLLDLYNLSTLLNTRVTFLEVRPTSLPSAQDNPLAMITASVQSMFEEMQNYSKDQLQIIQENKAQFENLIALLQAQITGQDMKISILSDRLKRINVSLINLENINGIAIDVETQNSQKQGKAFRNSVPLKQYNSYTVDGKPPLNFGNLSSTSPSSPFLSSSSSTVASPSSVAVPESNQNLDITSRVAKNNSTSIK